MVHHTEYGTASKIRTLAAELRGRGNPLPLTFDTVIAGAAEVALYATYVFPVIRESREELAAAFTEHGLTSPVKTDILHTTIARFQNFESQNLDDRRRSLRGLEEVLHGINRMLRERPFTGLTNGLFIGKALMFQDPRKF